MNKTEFLIDTIKYYHEDPRHRAVNSRGKCMYLAPDGRQCAIGRHLDKEKLQKLLKEDSSCNSIEVNSLPRDIIPKEIRRLPMDFLYSVQTLHDSLYSKFWNKKGITEEGLEYVSALCDDWDISFAKVKKEVGIE